MIEIKICNKTASLALQIKIPNICEFAELLKKNFILCGTCMVIHWTLLSEYISLIFHSVKKLHLNRSWFGSFRYLIWYLIYSQEYQITENNTTIAGWKASFQIDLSKVFENYYMLISLFCSKHIKAQKHSEKEEAGDLMLIFLTPKNWWWDNLHTVIKRCFCSSVKFFLSSMFKIHLTREMFRENSPLNQSVMDITALCI